jgi:hypothetical protein
MSGICKSFSAWLSAALVVALTFICMPQPAFAQPVIDHGQLHLRKPQFVVTAVKIHAVHETGTNWPGNDEVELLLSDFTDVGVTTAWFYNVDAGETFTVPAARNCVQPQGKCDHGVTDVHFRVALWENDTAPPPFANFCYGDLGAGDYWFAHGLCSGDDLIGRAEITVAQADLVAALPTVGASADYTVRPRGGDGNYEFTYRIARLPDVGRDIVIHEPPIEVLYPISLSAAVTSAGGPKRVVLTWAGATTNTVDIYRDGAKIVTTANDGSYDDPRPNGTYQYRVCDLGSATACSATVSVVVT